MNRMNFRNLKRTAIVDDEPIDVEGEIVAEELLHQKGHDSGHKSLVQISPDGKARILDPYDRIDLNQGDRFEAQLNATGGR